MNKVYYDNIWQEWLRKKDLPLEISRHIERYRPLKEEILKNLEIICKNRKIVRILEAGCGTGIMSYLLSENKDVEAYGVDISEKSIDLAQKIGIHFKGKVNFSVADVRHLEFEDRYFDIVFSQGLLEHFKNPLQVIAEESRVLRKNGILIIDVPQKYNLYTYRKHIKMKKGIWPWGWETEFSFRQLKKMGDSAGMIVIGVRGYGYGKRMERISKFMPKTFWSFIQSKFGHLFLNSIIAVFTK